MFRLGVGVFVGSTVNIIHGFRGIDISPPPVCIILQYLGLGVWPSVRNMRSSH